MTTRTYTKVARAAAEEQTRTALLDAAEVAFFDEGGAHSLEAIAAAAGVTKQTLLRHFGSREGLFHESHRRAFERVREQRLRAPRNDVEGAIDNLLDHYEAVGDRALRIGTMTTTELPADIGRVARQLHYEWVEHAFGAWLGAAEHRSRLRAALIAACDVQTWSIFAHDLGFERAEVRQTLLLIIRRLLEEDA
jgi:AcrR family transcriptional regulator